MITFIIATNNVKKLKELDRILNPLGIFAQTAKQAGVSLDDVEETGKTLEENALIKARAAFERTGKPCIADDSGLMVDALGGAPGVYSARYSGTGVNKQGATDEKNIQKLLADMKGEKNRNAYFATVICCILEDGTEITVTGKCFGTISEKPIGTSGFGYDPIFLTDNGKSFAQLTADEKDEISHRGNAIRLLKIELEKYFNKQKHEDNIC